MNYTQGALRYVFQTPNSNWGMVDGGFASFGVLSDAVVAVTLPRHNRPQPNHGLERQRGLRALLEPALADITIRRLCAGEL